MEGIVEMVANSQASGVETINLRSRPRSSLLGFFCSASFKKNLATVPAVTGACLSEASLTATAFFSPLAFVLVETGEPQAFPGEGGNNSALFVKLTVNLLLFIAYLSLLLALLFALLSRFGAHFCGHARQRTAADVGGNHPSPFPAFFVVVEPAASLFDTHCATPFVHPRLSTAPVLAGRSDAGWNAGRF